MTKVQLIPTKRFFVEMLTRDIELEDAILDLLDNCLDGVIRQGEKNDISKPYDGYWAEITFDKNHFKIKDNCGGIEKKLATEYAFRMGRPEKYDDQDKNLPTVGVYGIGMKRSIFKMGNNAKVESYTKTDGTFKVVIDEPWMKNDTEWQLDLIELNSSNDLKGNQYGTMIYIDNLHEGISKQFDKTSNSTFEQLLKDIISTHYSYIIRKGFSVKLNGLDIQPQITQIVYQEDFATLSNTDKVIAPYIYKSVKNDVEISVIVGFYRDLSTEKEENDALSGKPNASSKNAGWSIICNDRVVVFNDKSILTGWGEAGVPQYHTQFISIAGIVNFKSNDPSKLPLKTTKRGVDANSPLYMEIKARMREGLKIFTDFTNKWKSKTQRNIISSLDNKKITDTIDFLIENPNIKFSKSRNHDNGEIYKPTLPKPSGISSLKKITFRKESSDIRMISEYFFEEERSPKDIGEKCFDEILKKVKE
ncbi:ATP-binding protein [Pasteurella testudinis]|uniref:ATP-binding protein n=1 Tax=Pasteurella testudinis TaxID=761 RepID=UPI004057FE17